MKLLFTGNGPYGTEYTYSAKDDPCDPFPITLTIPYEKMAEIIDKHEIRLAMASECSYSAFKDWLEAHDNKEKFYLGADSFDIQSLVDIFDDELINAFKLKRANRNETEV